MALFGAVWRLGADAVGAKPAARWPDGPGRAGDPGIATMVDGDGDGRRAGLADGDVRHTISAAIAASADAGADLAMDLAIAGAVARIAQRVVAVVARALGRRAMGGGSGRRGRSRGLCL